MFDKKVIFFIFSLVFIAFSGFSQTMIDSAVTDSPKSLKGYQQQANELYNAFKNGPAFEVLQKYGDLKEKELNKEKAAELEQLESKFKTDYSRLQQQLAVTQQSVNSLKKENDSLEKEKQKMTRNTILFFVIFISVLIAILTTRRRMAKKAQTLAGVSTVQLERTITLSETSDALHTIHADLKFEFSSVFDLSLKSIPVISKLRTVTINQKKNPEEFQKLEENFKHIIADAENAVSSLAAIEQTHGEVIEEKIMTNLNTLISGVFDLSYHWIKSTDASFECEKVKDLEKILPEISIMPVAIRTALFHFFNNAFHSVYEKKKNSGKNYVPKISVTTRKLPRFVQVRIKDNGLGIADKVLSKIYAPFFTTKPAAEANGLGLTQCADIIKKKHSGEIIIESEPGKGTDFIIRFPLNTIM
ncbi:MAG: ATP-binding protein [Bacteroidia bacterium]